MARRVADEERSLRWWQILGPWPLNPVAVAMTAWLTATVFDAARLTASTAGVTAGLYPPVLVRNLPAMIAAGIVLWLLARPYRGQVPPAGMYWLALGTTVAVFVSIRFAMGLLPTAGLGAAQAIFAAMARTSLMVLFIQVATGITGYRLAVQMDKTNEALKLVREQQVQMLEADEQMRAQVSTLLHDRVQAGLIAACLELQDAAERAEPHLRDEIAEVVHRLEELRGIDVRRAARTLSPDLVDTDLHSAIEDLAARYGRSMRIRVDVAPQIVALATRPPKQLLLGVYRIIEQSLLNAAVHGRARNCAIDVALDDERVVVTVDDDGGGMSNGSQHSGLGTALVTTWVRILDGEWSRTSSPMGGVQVRATFPVIPA